jgi:hypothetical protein
MKGLIGLGHVERPGNEGNYVGPPTIFSVVYHEGNPDEKPSLRLLMPSKQGYIMPTLKQCFKNDVH